MLLVDQFARPFPPREEPPVVNHTRFDRWSNEATGIGTGSDKTVQGAFRPVWRILDQELTSLHSGADIAAKIVDSVPQEAFRRGYDLKCEDLNAKQIKLLREYGTDHLAVETNMLECWRWGRLYGGALMLLNVDDGGFPWEPLDETKIRSFDSISLVDRRYAFVQSQYSSLNRGKYGTPEIYLISNAVACSGWNSYTDRVRPKSGGELIREGAQASLVHESRTIRFDGNLADVVTRQQLAGWNWSVLQRVYNAMRQFEHAFDSAGYLLSDASQGVFKLQGLIKAIAIGQRGAFADRMALMEFTRSVMHGIVLDAGDEKNKPEEFVRQPTSFAGIPDLLDKMMLRLSVAAEMPATELFGRAPAGMNATGESDTRGWYSKIASKQENEVGPKLRRIYRLLALAKRGPLKGKDVNPGIHFHPLWSPTDQETAATLYTNAQRDALNITNGVVKPEEVAVGLKDIYPALNVEAREEVLRTMESFDPYEGDPEEPNPGAPVGPSGAAGVNAANQGEPAGGPMVPVPLFGGGGSPAKNAKAGTAATQGGPANLRKRPAPVTGPKMAKGTEPSGPAAPPDKAARAAEAAVAAGEKLPTTKDRADQNATAVAVWQQLRPDYPEEAIAWVLDYEWSGPEDIPLKSIDDSGAAKWAASREPISVAFHTIKIGEGTKKPIILVRVEGEKLENVADGHHRFLAYKTLGQPVSAYCVVVPKSEKRWQPMHDAQGMGSQQRSAQVGPVESADGVLGLDALKARSDARYEAWAAHAARFAAKGDAYDPGQPRTPTGQLTAHTATSLAQKATDASAKAVDAPTHHEAAAAHAFAGGMFRALSAKAMKLGNTAAAARHLASAEGHDAKATEHVMAAGMGATDDPETDESANVGAETTGAATADGGRGDEQERVPAGSPEGGEFMGANGGGSGAVKIIKGADTGKGYGGVKASLIHEVHEYNGSTGLQAIIHRTDGIKVYRYTDAHIQAAADKKFARADDMEKALPAMRETVAKDLHSTDPKTRDAAIVTSLVDQHAIRIGGSDAEERTGSRGASTLEAQHVIDNHDGTVNLKFPGKSGHAWDVHVTNPETAAAVKASAAGKAPGDKLFGATSNSAVNDYIKDASGKDISAKDFRTFHASRLMNENLSKQPVPKNAKEVQKNIKTAIEQTAHVLGHTPAVSRASYINPRIIDAYETAHAARTP